MQAALKSTMPERLCILTGEVAESDHLIRFALSPDARIVPDIAAKLPGRGFWITADKGLIDQAVASGNFAKRASRALKQPVSASAVAPDMADVIDRLLRDRCLNLLGLERRKGTLVLGFDSVAETVRAGRAAMLIEAADGAADGRSKLKALAEKSPRPVRMIDLFCRAELSLALGRENVVHAAVKSGGVAKALVKDLARLAAYRHKMPALGAGI